MSGYGRAVVDAAAKAEIRKARLARRKKLVAPFQVALADFSQRTGRFSCKTQNKSNGPKNVEGS